MLADLKISPPTVSKYYRKFRKACLIQESQAIHQVGGPGQSVEIDETQLCRKDKGKGRPRIGSDVWVFGGVCRETKKRFSEVVESRNRPTLSKLTEKYIRAGTRVMSDKWPAYQGLETWGDFTHLTVNHASNFVDPITGAHTQTVERMWRDMKEKEKAMHGIPKKDAPAYVAEYLVRSRWKLSGTPPFEGAIALVAGTDWPSRSETLAKPRD